MNRDRQQVLMELLVIQSQTGDPKAIGQLAELLQRELVAYATRLVADNHAARNVVQEAWISVMRTIGKLNDPAAFRSWVLRIFNDKSMDHLRKAVRDRNELRGMEHSLETNSTPETDEEENELLKIRKLIDALRPADRAVLILYYENGLSIREIAAITGNSESATKLKLFHIRQTLKLKLSKWERESHVRANEY